MIYRVLEFMLLQNNTKDTDDLNALKLKIEHHLWQICQYNHAEPRKPQLNFDAIDINIPL